MTHDNEQNAEAERLILQQARELSHKWGGRLDDFVLPCPLCKGELHFQGVYRDRLYEFAEDEPGVINPLDVLPISFICNRCGFTAEFDAELFNPAYLAQLEGEDETEIEDLRLHDFRVLIPMKGSDKSDTLLKLGTLLAGQYAGDVVVFNIDQSSTERLQEKLQDFAPAPGNPAPHLLDSAPVGNLRNALAEVAAEQKCNVLLIDSHTWMPQGLTPVTDAVTTDVGCDVCVVQDRGLSTVRRIMLVIGGGPNARAAAPHAISLAKACDAELHFLYVAPSTLEHPQTEGKRHILQMLGDITPPEELRVEYRIVVSNQLVPTVVDEAGHYDLLILGASNRDWLGRVRTGSMAYKIVRNCGVTSILVREQGRLIGSWFHRFIGS